jgi:RNA-binding protein YhbY
MCVSDDQALPVARFAGNSSWENEKVPVAIINRLWLIEKKPVLSIGASGFKASHASTIKEYLAANGCMKLKLAHDKINPTDLAATVKAHPELTDVHILRIRNRVLLFANTHELERKRNGVVPI